MFEATADRLAPEDGACGLGGAALGTSGAIEVLGLVLEFVLEVVLEVGKFVLAEMTRVCKGPNLLDVASMRQRLPLADSKKPRCNISTPTVSAQIFARLG